MRQHFIIYILAIAVVSGLFATSAFDAARVDSRVVTASVVGDSAAYVAIEANPSSPHAGYVSQAANGRISVDFSGGTGNGTGVNPDAAYEWDDIIRITNQGTATVYIKVNTSATNGNLTAALASSQGSMGSADYSTTTSVIQVTVGSTVYLGLRTDSTGLNSGDTLRGTFTIHATRTAS